MSGIEIVFIVLMVVWALAIIVPFGPAPSGRERAGGLLAWACVAILGWRVFGL